MPAKKSTTSHYNARKKITWRYILVSSVIVLFAGWIAYDMFRTTVLDAEKWIEKANKELEKREVIKPVRGEIISADGSVLATNLNFYTMRIDFRASKFNEEKYLESLDSLCDTLAFHHPERTRDEWRKYLSAPLKKAPKERSRNFTLLRNLSYAQSEAVRKYPFFRRSKNSNKTGLTCERVMRRCYPYGDMARRSIGRTGMTETSDEIHGISGLEYALDSLLYGKPGEAKKIPLTHNIVNWTDIAPTNGFSLTTTIDVNIQDIVEHELNDALKNMGAEWGTVVLMDVPTGDIKAISNLERDKKGNYIEAMNRAIQGFEPGSVMKTISMVIALEDGFVKNPDIDTYELPYGYKFGGGSPIKDTHSPHSLPVSRFLEYSSNIGMTRLVAPHFKDNPNGFRERIRKLGLLERFNTGIAGEHPPFFPHLDIKSGGLVSLGRQTYGYASQIPPLYICAFYNAIANNGQFVRPRLVSKFTTARGDSVVPVSYVNKNMCSPKTAAIVREMLHKVVYGKGGTAKTLQDDIIDIAGKTGTSRIARELSEADREKLRKNPKDPTVVRPKGYEEGAYRYAFCGFFPYDNPKYTCMVLVSRPGSHVARNAGVISGRILLNIAHRMFSRGMLDNTSDYHANQPKEKSTTPILYATRNSERDKDLTAMLGTSFAGKIHSPKETPGGTVPDVTGLGLREAIVVLEKAGFEIAFHGDGTVHSQTPAPGSRASQGTKVHLNMKRR